VRDAEKLLADFQRLETAMLLELLRPVVGGKNRNRAAIAVAVNLAETRYARVERGEKERCLLDKLIEDVAIS
jgi:hypothetical protein